MLAFVIILLVKYHWLPLVAFDCKMPLFKVITGVAGIGFVVTFIVCAADGPHPLFAVTVMFPPVVPAVALIEFVVEFPVQPFGKFHV